MPDVLLTGSLRALAPARRDVVLALKRRGESTAEDLAADMGYSVGAARSLLIALAADGFVTHRGERRARGRPRHIYSLTEMGEELFPQIYRAALESMLEVVHERYPELIMELRTAMVRRWVLSDPETTRIASLPLEAKVAAVADHLNSLGYLAEVTSPCESGQELAIYHCPLLAMARHHPESVCGGETMLIELSVPELRLERVRHRIAGDSRCVYRFSSPSSAEDPAPATPGK
jgi:predicted ArsR family transcriptional regulator